MDDILKYEDNLKNDDFTSLPLHKFQNSDFLIYNEDGIIPIEVKASSNIKSKSLGVYIDKYNPKYAIRVSTKNFGFENGIKSVPLYAAFLIR